MSGDAWVVEVRLAEGPGGPPVLEALEALEAAGAEALEVLQEARPARAWGLFSGEAAPLEAAVQVALRARGVAGAEVRASAVERSDWASVVQLGLRPVVFGDLAIVPPGCPAPPAARHVLTIETAGAFGSGLHPSTALVLERLAALPPAPAMLDVGTGTGILALAALSWGTERVVGTDIDPRALAVAAEIAAAAGLQERLTLLAGGPEAAPGQFARVVANVLAAPLADLAPEVVRRLAPGSQLLLSGLQPHQAPEVVKAYRDRGLWWVGETAARGWVCLELRPSW